MFFGPESFKKRSAKVADEWSTFFCGTNIFSQTIQFHDISAKKYLILNTKRKESGSKNMVSCLGQGRKMSNFVSNRVTGFEGFSDTPLLKLQLKSPPLPPPPAPEYTNQNLNNGEMQKKDCIYEFK